MIPFYFNFRAPHKKGDSPRGRHRGSRPGKALRIVLAAAWLGWLAGAVLGQPALTVAVMDFQNLSQFSEHDYLQKAVPELLLTDLAISKKLALVERSRLQEVMAELKLSLTGAVDSATALKVGRLAGAGALILGSIIKAGDTFRIDVRLTEVATGRIILAEKIQWSSEDDIINQVDLLAGRVIKKLTGEEVALGEAPAGSTAAAPGKAVSMEAVADNTYRLAGSTGPAYLEIDLYSKEIRQTSRIPLNVALVIDRSGSMGSENKLENAKQAAEFVVRNLEKNDFLSLVTYESNVQTPVAATHPDNKPQLVKIIKEIATGGSTNLSGGMLEGYAQADKNRKKGQVNRVLLLSDGLANQGIQDPRQLQEICRQKANAGLTISTFGVGVEYNEDLMLNLAEYGNGNYYFIDDPVKIAPIFTREMKGLLAVVAQNVTLTVKPGKGVTVDQVIGYRAEPGAGRSSLVSLGDIFSNQSRTILVRLTVPARHPGTLDLAAIELAFDDVTGTKQRQDEKAALTLTYTDNPQTVNEHENRQVGRKVSVLTSSVALQEAASLVDKGELEKARSRLAGELQNIKQAAAKYQSRELKKQILSVSKYQEDLEDYEKKEEADQKMMQKSVKYRSYEQLKSK